MNRLIEFDLGLGYDYVAGTDEAGRGCLAGPIVAAAVRFSCQWLSGEGATVLAELDDSKRKSEAARERLFPSIVEGAQALSVAVIRPMQIDQTGVHKANLEVLTRALLAVRIDGSALLVDGFSLPKLGYEHSALKRGDATSAAIAAASVIAKVTRDRYMTRAQQRYPGWGFADHAGYGTPKHKQAIMRLGITPLHRLSFRSDAYASLNLEGTTQVVEQGQLQIAVN